MHASSVPRVAPATLHHDTTRGARRWMNWTYDEVKYEEEKGTQNRHVFPDWDPATQSR